MLNKKCTCFLSVRFGYRAEWYNHCHRSQREELWGSLCAVYLTRSIWSGFAERQRTDRKQVRSSIANSACTWSRRLLLAMLTNSSKTNPFSKTMTWCWCWVLCEPYRYIEVFPSKRDEIRTAWRSRTNSSLPQHSPSTPIRTASATENTHRTGET